MRQLLLVVVLAGGCGTSSGGVGGGGVGGGAAGTGGGGMPAPKAGDACEAGGACDGDHASLWCEDTHDGGTFGRLHQYPCRGSAGCTSNSSKVVCDFNGAFPDDLCPDAADGIAFCRPDAGNTPGEQLLTCIGRVWQRRDCKNCRVANNQVLCDP